MVCVGVFFFFFGRDGWLTFSSVQFSASAHILACFRTCDLLAQISVGGRPLLHEHEVAVQTATQPGNSSPPPGTTYRSGATEHCLLSFQVHVRFHVCLRLSWTSTLLAVGITPTTTAGFSKGLSALLTEFTRRVVHF